MTTTDDLSDMIPKLKSLPEFTDIDKPRFIDDGGYGDVYLVNQRKSLAGKILFASDELKARFRICELQKEYNICGFLFINGVSVPRPKGIYRLSVDFVKPERRERYGVPQPAAFVMEYIHGISKEEDFSEREKEVALRLRDRELDKARCLGYIAIDVGFGNIVYQPEQKRVVLIDYGLWERK